MILRSPDVLTIYAEHQITISVSILSCKLGVTENNDLIPKL